MDISKVFVTGAAGFVGSNLVDYLLKSGVSVVGYDNFSTGFREFVSDARKSKQYQLIQGDLLHKESLANAMVGCDFVFHFAANADVRNGLNNPSVDLQQNTIATFNVLEAMREQGIHKIAFSSTGSIYGEATQIPTPEEAQFPIQTSLYGASKLAAEGLIQAFCEGYKFEGYIFRFVSLVGPRYSHGHVFDFVKKLLKNPKKLHILGNGKQRKSYLYIHDCIRAMMGTIDRKLALANPHNVEICNLGTNEYCEVMDSVGWICNELQVTPEYSFSGGERGWVGDNPFIFLDTKKIQSTGWTPKLSIEQGIRETVRWLIQNKWLFRERD